jgi:hypothetical protein
LKDPAGQKRADVRGTGVGWKAPRSKSSRPLGDGDRSLPIPTQGLKLAGLAAACSSWRPPPTLGIIRGRTRSDLYYYTVNLSLIKHVQWERNIRVLKLESQLSPRLRLLLSAIVFMIRVYVTPTRRSRSLSLINGAGGYLEALCCTIRWHPPIERKQLLRHISQNVFVPGVSLPILVMKQSSNLSE